KPSGRLYQGRDELALVVAIATWLGERCCRGLAEFICRPQVVQSARWPVRSTHAAGSPNLLRRNRPESTINSAQTASGDQPGERNAESRSAFGVPDRSVRRGEGLSGLVGRVPIPLEEGG